MTKGNARPSAIRGQAEREGVGRSGPAEFMIHRSALPEEYIVASIQHHIEVLSPIARKQPR
jgi:hypothetical protein